MTNDQSSQRVLYWSLDIRHYTNSFGLEAPTRGPTPDARRPIYHQRFKRVTSGHFGCTIPWKEAGVEQDQPIDHQDFAEDLARAQSRAEEPRSEYNVEYPEPPFEIPRD